MSASLRASVSTSSAAATSRARRTAASRGRHAAASASATAAPPVSAPEAIVVGGGVGGLAMAGRLARAGYAVTLLEKNAEVGGRLQSYNPPDAPGWRFDTGPSLLLFPDKYRECFEALGERMEDHLDVVRVSPAYRAHFGDGTSFDLSYDMGELRSQLEAIEKGAGGAFFDFLGRARVSLDLGVRAFIERDSTSAADFLNPALVLPLALKVNPLELLGSAHGQMSAYFKSEKLRALFSFQELYVGLSPYTAPGVFSLLAATELTDGVWYPRGGFGTVRDALRLVAEKLGVRIRPGAAVEQVLVQPGGAAGGAGAVAGVRLAGGEELRASLVVANPDLPWVYSQLLTEADASASAGAAGAAGAAGDDAAPSAAFAAEARRLDAMEYSASVIAYNFALSAPLPRLLHHNVFLSSDYRGSWERPACPAHLAAPRQLNFYVHNPCFTDPSSAPPGASSVMVLLPVANLQEQAAWAAAGPGRALPDQAEMIAAGREAIFRRWEADGMGDVRSLVVSETVIPPAEWAARYNIQHGAVFGLSHGLTQLACFRPPTRTGLPASLWPQTPVPTGLYFVGASTRPGNGVPLVMMGVAVTFENIVRDARARLLGALPAGLSFK